MQLWIILAILAPFLWACSNIIQKVVTKHHLKSAYTYVMLSGLVGIPIWIFFLTQTTLPSATQAIICISVGLISCTGYTLYLTALTKEEVSLAESHGYRAVRIHSNILRAETAPIAFAAMATVIHSPTNTK